MLADDLALLAAVHGARQVVIGPDGTRGDRSPTWTRPVHVMAVHAQGVEILATHTSAERAVSALLYEHFAAQVRALSDPAHAGALVLAQHEARGWRRLQALLEEQPYRTGARASLVSWQPFAGMHTQMPVGAVLWTATEAVGALAPEIFDQVAAWGWVSPTAAAEFQRAAERIIADVAAAHPGDPAVDGGRHHLDLPVAWPRGAALSWDGGTGWHSLENHTLEQALERWMKGSVRLPLYSAGIGTPA